MNVGEKAPFADEVQKSSQAPTILEVVPGSPSPAVRSRPEMAMVLRSQDLTGDFNALLRHRLGIAGLIALGGFTIFFIKGLFDPSTPGYELTATDRAVHALVLAVQTFACALVWSKVKLPLRTLRWVEIALFGSAAAFFAYLQAWSYHGGHFLEGVDEAHQQRTVQLQNMATGIRWYVLIVLYGTFIPNTWRRCVVAVSILVAVPLLLTFGMCAPCRVMGQHTWSSMFDLAVILSMAAATALFGSYKITTLQEEAQKMRRLGQYVLHGRLGEGGMGEVYLAEHVLLRRDCAIKLIRPDFAKDAVTLSRFEREVQAMAMLTHWNTVEIYDYGRTPEGSFYYVMEYLPGMSLQDLVDTYGPQPAERAIFFLRQVCAGLREAHERGLIHRDIKPSNVIACKRGGLHDVAKLVDFGLVHEVGLPAQSDKLTLQGTILGSPHFISPEQAKGRAKIDGRADVYSLGAMGYFLVTGQTPFRRESVMELLAAHIHELPPSPDTVQAGVPDDLAAVIMRCLAKNPDDRFSSVNELDEALSKCRAANAWGSERARQWWKEQCNKGKATNCEPETAEIEQTPKAENPRSLSTAGVS